MMARSILVVCCLLVWHSFSAFSQGVTLTEGEFKRLLQSIKTAKQNSQQQGALIAELKETLEAQAMALQQALNTLREVSSAVEQSEAESNVLKTSLVSIQSYSQELNDYSLRLEHENRRLKSKTKGLQVGWGISGGAAAAVILVLLLIL